MKAVIASVETKVKGHPHQNIHKLATDFKVDKMTISLVVRYELGIKSREVTKVHGLTALERGKKAQQVQNLAEQAEERHKKTLIFSDEKIFTVDAVSSSMVTRYIAKWPEDISLTIMFKVRTNNPTSSMILGVIGVNGNVFPSYWVKGIMTWPSPRGQYHLWDWELGLDP